MHGFSLCPASWLTDKWGVQSPVPAAPHLILLSSSAVNHTRTDSLHQIIASVSGRLVHVLLFLGFFYLLIQACFFFFWLWFLPDDFGYLCSVASPVSVQPCESSQAHCAAACVLPTCLCTHLFLFFDSWIFLPLTLTVPLLCLFIDPLCPTFFLFFWHRVFAEPCLYFCQGFLNFLVFDYFSSVACAWTQLPFCDLNCY